ncbi:hypothetical protein MPTK1_5g15000 [Marchantia polymorpha subsp. ruderalis]|uniref:YDG domain-containing protein n=2 Tax=Marchantia polymorpha TaxID=3197 RepID=A0AAF6BII0_MARPO|nr:hypothetical protein MARPO_0071s0110 [Marchantia polymorpha]PTQ35508.1 hypothetical protein MARPO_0071s0110 [Marchantia polymorpha]BBN11814.1 hypothetical protein Mp_5g15000 [Marchantia polymorpha subsp. ruderalis]BBN11815.1 hypothetical protein Mp_5g15000 [Marchantia polymorpha subsp. ruderalis]|eukprot:PTQ35507.1 hypothetical protein MARPO_0071s0110 [Marchantia polymorpha]
MDSAHVGGFANYSAGGLTCPSHPKLVRVDEGDENVVVDAWIPRGVHTGSQSSESQLRSQIPLQPAGARAAEPSNKRARHGVVKRSGKKFLRTGQSKGRSLLMFGTKAQDKPRPVTQFRRSGPSFDFHYDDLDVKILLTKFEQVRKQYRKENKKEMSALRDFCRDYWYLFCNGRASIDGKVPGIKVGQCFYLRTELFLVALHHRIQAGIDYFPVSKSPVMAGGERVSVAVSVVVTGNFEDDVDEGERIMYCGEGGRPFEGVDKGQQTQDQTLVRGNLALYNSYKLGRSVRVIRKHRDESSPSGYIYSYDGLYKVSQSYRKRGKSGLFVFMFELNRLPNQGQLKW